MKNVYGGRAIVTGSSSGIGLAIAQAFTAEGIKVFGLSRSGGHFDGCFGCAAMDVTNEQSMRTGMAAAIDKLGGVDILVNCAGYGIAGAVEDITASELREQLEVNFIGSVSVIQQALPHMRDAGKGIIINISSVAGVVSIPFQSSYSASKYALEAVTDALRIECAPFGVKACLIEPGDTRTSFTGRRVLGENAGDGSSYYPALRRALFAMEQSELHGHNPEKVARQALKMLGRRRPPARRPVGYYRLLCGAAKLLPAWAVQRALAIMYGRDMADDSELHAK